MFTGIIEELGTVRSLESAGGIFRLEISASGIARDIRAGESVCVNGACLTIVRIKQERICFEIMPETFKTTNLGLLERADKVNLERALPVNGRMDGHFVTGHIDGTGTIAQRRSAGGDVAMKIETSGQILRYIVFKGAVALDGVSLTVSARETNSFTVSLIPYTLEHSTLGLKQKGGLVNIECDILAKYIERFIPLNQQAPPS